MHSTTIMIMRELIDSLDQVHHGLRRRWRDKAQLAEFDRAARLTIHRANATVTIYEEEPLRERDAIVAMYAACAVGLHFRDLVERTPNADGDHVAIERAVAKIERLLLELWSCVVGPCGEPVLEIEI